MTEIKCLDKGFVQLVDWMGSDLAIVQAARVSYHGVGIKTASDDKTLLRYLLRNKHTSPFEMVEFKFHCKMPIFVARQWIRHRTANVNEVSGRYSELPNEFYVPEDSVFTKQNPNNKQGGTNEMIPFDGFRSDSRSWSQDFAVQQCEARNNYEKFLTTGVRKELARINLPLSQYTEWYWKIDLHNLLHFLRLRLSDHAQYEIRVYAEAIAEIIKSIVPETYAAFEDYILNSVTFSQKECKFLKECLEVTAGDGLMDFIGFSETEFSNKREREEFVDKIKKLIK